MSSRIQFPALSYRDYLIFKVDGFFYYRSLGTENNIPGMVLPFYGIAEKGSIVIDAGHYNEGEFVLPSGLPITKFQDQLTLIWSPLCSDKDAIEYTCSRFASLEQLYVSYKFGHSLWDGVLGNALVVNFKFIPDLRGCLPLPNHVIFEEDPAKVNAWLISDNANGTWKQEDTRKDIIKEDHSADIDMSLFDTGIPGF